MLPRGGYSMTQVEAYFDESGSHRHAPVLCVAGYVMEKDAAIELSREWSGVLKARTLPYFRMSECAHGNGPFKTLSLNARVQVALRMIQIIEEHTEQGLAVTVNEENFNRLLPRRGLIGSPYGFAAHLLLAGVRSWIESHPPVSDAAYFFEAGHRSQAESNDIMTLIFKQPALRVASRYSGHAFVKKECTPAVQAADLLAWQWYTDKRHELEGRPRRRDCSRLLRHEHKAVHIGEDRLAEIATVFPHGVNDEKDLLMFQAGDRYC
jgi:hypothetical protein